MFENLNPYLFIVEPLPLDPDHPIFSHVPPEVIPPKEAYLYLHPGMSLDDYNITAIYNAINIKWLKSVVTSLISNELLVYRQKHSESLSEEILR